MGTRRMSDVERGREGDTRAWQEVDAREAMTRKRHKRSI